MIRTLRSLSLRFWVVCLVALPMSFWTLPSLTAWLPGTPMPVIVAGLFILAGLSLGLGLDFLGTRRIQALIREGELWERAGIHARAEKRYIRAMEVFDSAWISPLAARRSASPLRDALTRFFLTSGSRHPGFEIAAAMTLKSDPEDETLALLWLGRLGALNRADSLTQSVLTTLADAHYAHPKIARELILVFLSLGRVDFSAKRLYRHFPDHFPADAGEEEALRSAILKLTGDLQPPPGPGAVKTLGEQRNGVGQRPSGTGLSPGISRLFSQQGVQIATGGITRFSDLIRAAGKGFFSVLAGLKALIARTWEFLRKKEKLSLYLKWALVGLLGLWLVFFVLTTLSHMLKSTNEPAQRIEMRILKPLTIQVAAYLTLAHADRYVAVLKKKGIIATIKTTEAGGKTWYLVRISEFTDKESAENYGNRLKTDKIIDDFFVSNK